MRHCIETNETLHCDYRKFRKIKFFLQFFASREFCAPGTQDFTREIRSSNKRNRILNPWVELGENWNYISVKAFQVSWKYFLKFRDIWVGCKISLQWPYIQVHVRIIYNVAASKMFIYSLCYPMLSHSTQCHTLNLMSTTFKFSLFSIKCFFLQIIKIKF